MKLFTAMITTVALLISASTNAQTLVITRGGSRAASPAPAENFTGGVRVEALFEALDPSHASGGSVTFEPGARTAWHSHPRGQILIVTAGTGRVQRWGDPIEEIRQGDVVRIPAGEKHWHGASPQASMTHIAITEHRDGIESAMDGKGERRAVQRCAESAGTSTAASSLEPAAGHCRRVGSTAALMAVTRTLGK